MSWKRADRTPEAAPSSGARLRPWSLTVKLATLCTTVAGVVLLGVAVLSYEVLMNDFDQDQMAFLAEELDDIRQVVKHRPNTLKAAIHAERIAHRYHPYFVRVMDADGRAVAATVDMPLPLTMVAFPPPIRDTASHDVHLTDHQNGSRSYRLLAAWAESPAGEQSPWLVQIALDVTPDEALMTHYRLTLVLACMAGLLMSAAGSVLVARLSVRPLCAITASMQQITAWNLHKRISPGRWPRELTALAQSFDAMLERLENAFARLRQFSADLAHELRIPIQNLQGVTEVTLSRPRIAPEYREALASNLEEYARLASMIDDLLFLARAENPQQEVNRLPLDGRKELDIVREFFEVMAEDQGVAVECRGHATLHADPLLVRRALSNLLSNALRHTPRGGTITLTVQQEANDTVVISVHDTGHGIAAEHLPKLFDRFYQVDAARTPGAQGTGLGLSIVQSIMVLHGGIATMESTPANGTTAYLRFPSTRIV